MKAELRACDFCWNDDAKIVLAKETYRVPTPGADDDNKIDVCAKHAKGAAEVGIETVEIVKPELPFW